MAQTGSAELVGVVGSPIRHSLSPTLHRAAFAALGLGWTSEAFEVGVGQGAEVVQAMMALGIRGLSVTMPLKEEVADAVDHLDATAALLRSVNTLTLHGDTVTGSSTDGQGLLDALERDGGFDPSGRRAVVIGAGGAARSVAAALGASGAASVSIVARSPQAALDAAALAGPVGRVGAAADAHEADVVINATPVGMAGTPSESAPNLVDPSLLGPGQLVVELVYRPAMTPWLEAARHRGAEIRGGLGMLVHQAARAITLWTGFDAPVEDMWRAVHATEGVAPW